MSLIDKFRGKHRKKRESEEPKVVAEMAQGTVGQTKSLKQDFSSESRKGEIGRDLNDSIYNQGDGNVTSKTDVSIGTAIFADSSRSAGEIFGSFQGKAPESHPPPSPPKTDSPILLDVHHIRNFDLKTVVDDFADALNYRENAFAFSLNIPCPHACRQYVLERLRDAMWEKLGCEVEYKELLLRPEDETRPSDLLQRLRKLLDGSIAGWFSGMRERDFMISLWNYNNGKIPGDSMARISASAWEHFRAGYSGGLRENGQRLVVVFVTLADAPVALEAMGFTPLNVPAAFDSDELIGYFRSLLTKAGLVSSLIEDFLERLSARSGKIADAYREMESIVEELKGMPTHARR
jgi:hypothetical protein